MYTSPYQIEKVFYDFLQLNCQNKIVKNSFVVVKTSKMLINKEWMRTLTQDYNQKFMAGHYVLHMKIDKNCHPF